MVQDDPRLYHSGPVGGVELENAVEVLREVQNNRYIAALAGQAGAGPAGQYGSIVTAGDFEGIKDIRFVFRENHPNRDLAVIGSVRGVECPGPGVKVHLALKGQL